MVCYASLKLKHFRPRDGLAIKNIPFCRFFSSRYFTGVDLYHLCPSVMVCFNTMASRLFHVIECTRISFFFFSKACVYRPAMALHTFKPSTQGASPWWCCLQSIISILPTVKLYTVKISMVKMVCAFTPNFKNKSKRDSKHAGEMAQQLIALVVLRIQIWFPVPTW